MKYTIAFEKIPAFGFLIGRGDSRELIIMIPFKSIIIKKVKQPTKPIQL